MELAARAVSAASTRRGRARGLRGAVVSSACQIAFAGAVPENGLEGVGTPPEPVSDRDPSAAGIGPLVVGKPAGALAVVEPPIPGTAVVPEK